MSQLRLPAYVWRKRRYNHPRTQHIATLERKNNTERKHFFKTGKTKNVKIIDIPHAKHKDETGAELTRVVAPSHADARGKIILNTNKFIDARSAASRN